MPEPQEIQAIKEINEIIRKAGMEAGKRAVDYLTITNGGGAVACIAFMGSTAEFHDSEYIRLLLLIFVVGVALVGVMIVRDVEFGRKIMWRFAEKANDFHRGRIGFAEVMTAVDVGAAKKHALRNRALGFGSLIAFMLGASVSCGWLIFAGIYH